MTPYEQEALKIIGTQGFRRIQVDRRELLVDACDLAPQFFQALQARQEQQRDGGARWGALTMSWEKINHHDKAAILAAFDDLLCQLTS